MKIVNLLIMNLVLIANGFAQSDSQLKLWHNQPVKQWVEAQFNGWTGT